MPTPVVWTEREPGFPWTECTHSAVLIVLVGGGKTTYPAGMYANAERHALANLDGITNHQGSNFIACDRAISIRYGLSLHRPGGSGRITSDDLRSRLRTAGSVYALAGSNAALPAGATNWDPAFRGAHAAAVATLGGDFATWLDPLAPDRFAGERIAVQEIVAWAARLNGNSHDPRWLALGELGGEETMDPNRDVPIATCTVLPGGTMYADPNRQAVLASPWPPGPDPVRNIGIYALPAAPTTGGKSSLCPIRVDMLGGPAQDLRIGWVGADKVTDVSEGDVPPPVPADCSVEVQAERDRWTTWFASRPNLGLADWLDQAPD